MLEFCMADVFEEKLKGRLGEKFQGEVESKISEFGGLLTRGAAVRLLCRQHNIDVEQKVALKEAEGSHLPFSFEACVDRIFPVQTYQNKLGKSVRLHISDASSQATMVLWNEQAGIVEGGISVGDCIRCTGAYFRSGEIAVSKNGKIEKSRENPRVAVSKLTAGTCNVEGEVGEIEMAYHYLDKKTGEKKSLSSFQLCEEGVCRRVVVWSAPEGTPKIVPGDRLLLENVSFKNGELHFNSYSRMVKKTSASEKSGRLEKITVRGGEAVFSIGSSDFSLPITEALGLLGISAVPSGVSTDTLILIKSGELSGKKLKYRVEEGKLSWLSN